MLFISFLSLGLGATITMEDTARLAPAPGGREDPLDVLRACWALGSRGTLVRVDDSPMRGYFLIVDEWPIQRATQAEGILFLRDPELVALLHETSTQTRLVIHTRSPCGGMACPVGSRMYELMRQARPDIDEPFVIVNAWSNLYSLHHEMAHHLDHVDRNQASRWCQLWETLPSRGFGEAHIRAVYDFMMEARAHHREFAAVHDQDRPREYYASRSSDDHSEISEVNGPSFRRWWLMYSRRAFNGLYARPLDAMSEAMRAHARELFEREIPDFTSNFDARDRMLDQCEVKILTGA